MSLCIIEKDRFLYGSKSYTATEIINFTKKSKNKCDKNNSSWFGTYDASKRYETYTNKIRQWKVHKSIKLLCINKQNENYFKDLFLKTRKKLIPLIDIILSKDIYDHPYINEMTIKERCLYEFNFAFGYITITEQYKFIQLLVFLIEKKYITIFSRSKDSILPKIKLRIFYYHLNFFKNKNVKYNRYSIYEIDKIVIQNICKLVNDNGIYQENAYSFWYPGFFVNIEEFILFRPQQHLTPIEDLEEYIKNNIPHFKDINEFIKKIGNPNLKKESNILFYFDKKIIEYNKKECLKSINSIGMIMV